MHLLVNAVCETLCFAVDIVFTYNVLPMVKNMNLMPAVLVHNITNMFSLVDDLGYVNSHRIHVCYIW